MLQTDIWKDFWHKNPYQWRLSNQYCWRLCQWKSRQKFYICNMDFYLLLYWLVFLYNNLLYFLYPFFCLLLLSGWFVGWQISMQIFTQSRAKSMNSLALSESTDLQIFQKIGLVTKKSAYFQTFAADFNADFNPVCVKIGIGKKNLQVCTRPNT